MDLSNIEEARTSGAELDVKAVGADVEDLDAGEIFLRKHGISYAYLQEMLKDEPRNTKLMCRVDVVILPLLCGTVVLQFIDKQALSYGAVFDLLPNTHINSEQYSWLSSIFYFGRNVSSGIVCNAMLIRRCHRLLISGISCYLSRTNILDWNSNLWLRV